MYVLCMFFMFVCMYVCMYVRIYVCMYADCASFYTHRSSQCSTTGVTKAVVCVSLYVGWCI